MKDIEIITRLTGVDKSKITISNNGFLSYGYIIGDGELIFKFKKNPSVTYENEIELLQYLDAHIFNINLQKVAFVSPDDSYVGLYGVKGFCVENRELPEETKISIGTQVGKFLKELHSLSPLQKNLYSLQAELTAWKERFIESLPILDRFFTEDELAVFRRFILEEAPEKLEILGENYVFSHADLGEGNIFLDSNGKIGIIDFNESGYADEAADFMDIEDDIISEAALLSYGADEALREKVRIRRLLRPLFIIGTYSERGEMYIQKYVKRIKETLL